MKKILNILCSSILIILLNVLIGCYSGEPAPEPCDRVIVGHIKLPDSLKMCTWYQKDFESIQFTNSLGKSLTFNRSYLETKYIPLTCDSVYSQDNYRAEFRSKTISPNLTMGSSVYGQKPKVKHLIYLIAGAISMQIFADSMKVEKPNFIEYINSLDSFGTHFTKCYHVWRKADGASNNEGIIFSNQEGILAFYTADGISWHRE